jgi:regulator of nonsense transcripts 2
MDSSIKRNTALTKKLGKITEEGRVGIIDDLRTVNISKYVTEAVAATVESKVWST